MIDPPPEMREKASEAAAEFFERGTSQHSRLTAAFIGFLATIAQLQGERDALGLEVSYLNREVSRESGLRHDLDRMLKRHTEWLTENRRLDEEARAATDALRKLRGGN